ncbi:MAG: hypothetical protein ABI556_02910 [Gemmatimonadales bacterium]
MRRHSKAARRKIEEFQNHRLRRLIAHAYERVPFYRDHFDTHGIRPDHIRTAADLARIPPVTKAEMLRADLSTLFARGTDRTRLKERRTSGMTGEPFRIWRTPREELLSGILIAREMRTLGVRPRDVIAQIKMTGVPIDRPPPAPAERLIASLGRRVLRGHRVERHVKVNAGLPVEEVIDAIKMARPTIVAGYAGVLAHVARKIATSCDAGLRPRMVISGAEVLTERMREQIANAFGAPVYDTYGCHELGRIATECRETGEMHVCDDSVLVEIEGENGRPGEGESGSVIATSLHSWAMPFIRYQLGDVAVRGRAQCECGLPFSTLSEISGRKYDYFRAADGSAISPHLILDTVQMDALGWIERYQFIQEVSGRVLMPIVPATPPSDDQLTELDARMRTALGPGLEFEHRIVDTLEFQPGGKTRRFKSEVESDYH